MTKICPSTPINPVLTSQEREAKADKQLRDLMHGCHTWETHDATAKKQLYGYLQECAVTLAKTQHPNDGSEGWYEADALHKVISDAYSEANDHKTSITATDYNAMRDMLVYLLFPRARSGKSSNQMRYNYRKVLKAVSENVDDLNNAAAWIEEQGGTDAIGRNYDTDGKLKPEPKPKDTAEVEYDWRTLAIAEGEGLLDILEEVPEGNPVVLIGVRDGDKVIIHAGTHSKSALNVAARAAQQEKLGKEAA